MYNRGDNQATVRIYPPLAFIRLYLLLYVTCRMLSRKKLGIATPCMSTTTSAPSAPSGSSRHT